MHVLSDLWKGNIAPWKRSFARKTIIDAISSQVRANEQTLRNMRSPEGKQAGVEIQDAQIAASCLDSQGIMQGGTYNSRKINQM